jgi:hypothetical protein
MTDPKKPAPPPPVVPAYAPASLSIRVQCEKGHPMTGLFVIVRMAVAGDSSKHDAVMKIANEPPAKPDDKGSGAPAAAAVTPDPPSLVKFVCTIVDGHGFLQPVTDKNPWHWLWNHDPLVTKAPKGAAVKNGDIVRLSVDPGAQYVACLLRHPQPSVARALTHWLNTGDDPENHGFAGWPKARQAAITGEPSLGGRELLARGITLESDQAKGTQLVLKVSESPDDYLPPKTLARDGWLLYYDMPNASCEPVVKLVTKLQKKVGLLRFPLGGENNPYQPRGPNGEGDVPNIGQFDGRTVSAVKTFQEHAGRGEAFKPVAWPPGHDDESDGAHDWWFAIGTDTTIPRLAAVIPGCADETTWAGIDDWVKQRVCKREWVLVKNPSTYMRVDAALSVIAWKKLAELFGVDYGPNAGARQLSSGYSLAQYYSTIEKPIAHPHKTGHALDFSVIADSVGGGNEDLKTDWKISDWAHARANWPIHFEGQWIQGVALDLARKQRAALEAAKADRTKKDTAQKAKAAEEARSKKLLDDATKEVTDSAALPTTDPDPKKAASLAKAAKNAQQKAGSAQTAEKKSHDKAVEARDKASADMTAANSAVDKAQKDYDKAKAEDDQAKIDPSHGYWNLYFRLYGHSKLDFFGDAAAVDAAFDKLHGSINGMTATLVGSLVKALGPGAPSFEATAFFTQRLGLFLKPWEDVLVAQIGPPDARNQTGRLDLRKKVLRAWLTPWNYNPYAHSGGTPGAKVYPNTDTEGVDFENPATTNTRNVPKDSKSFVNLTYLGWKCQMLRISNGAGRDPHWKNGKAAPRRTMGPMTLIFTHLVGLVDRMRRADSDEKDEDIICGSIAHKVADLDVEFMLAWARALPQMTPGKHTIAFVTIQAPQVTIQLSAVDAGMAQLETVFAKLDESGAKSFAIVAIGKEAILDPALVAASGKPALVAGDVGKIDTGAAWRAKLENVATLFKDSAPVNQTPASKAPGAGAKRPAPVKSVQRDSADLRISLQPIFEKTVPTSLDAVAFRVGQNCEMPTPGNGEQLEWWHYQHFSSAKVPYPAMLAQIGYWPDLLFARREAPEADSKDVYNGRGVGSVITAAMAPGTFTWSGDPPHEIENGESEYRIGL